MPSSFTPSLRLTLPADGELVGTWGQTVNTGITALEEAAIAGTTIVSVTDGADTVLTTANGAADQARSMILRFIGTLTAPRNVICPGVSKLYVVRNGTTGGFGVTIKTLSGAGVSVPAGTAVLVYCDGVNISYAVDTFGTVNVTGGVNGVPTLALKTGGVDRVNIDSIGSVTMNGTGSAGTNPLTVINSGASGISQSVYVLQSPSGLVNKSPAGGIGFHFGNVEAAIRVTHGGDTSNAGLSFQTGAAGQSYKERMYISPAGNIGVGTNSPLPAAEVGYGTMTLNGSVGGLLSLFCAGVEHGRIETQTDQLIFAAGQTTGNLRWRTGGQQRMTMDNLGNLVVGNAPGAPNHVIRKDTGEGGVICQIDDATGLATTSIFSACSGAGGSLSACALRLAANSSTGRSINAGGTFNASGADYAEYERNGYKFEKGDVVGFDAEGILTNRFDLAVRFGIKSTDPSYVGGDTWGAGLEGAELVAAQETVDRVAYSGKVPVNVLGGAPGGYIIAVADEDGYIVGGHSATVSFELYLRAVGRVNRILDDGRAEVAVIIH